MKNVNPWWDPVELINRLQTKKVNPQDLINRQRAIIVKYFMENQPEFSNIEIARLLGISDMSVHRWKKKALRQATWEIDDMDIKILAVALKKSKENLQRRAYAAQDNRLAWQIECEFISKMQDLGFVYKAPEKVAIAGRLEMETETGLKKFFGEIGVLSVEQFVLSLGKLCGDGDGDGGDGKDRSIEDRREVKGVLVAPGKSCLSKG